MARTPPEIIHMTDQHLNVDSPLPRPRVLRSHLPSWPTPCVKEERLLTLEPTYFLGVFDGDTRPRASRRRRCAPCLPSPLSSPPHPLPNHHSTLSRHAHSKALLTPACSDRACCNRMLQPRCVVTTTSHLPCVRCHHTRIHGERSHPSPFFPCRPPVRGVVATFEKEIGMKAICTPMPTVANLKLDR